MPVRIKVFDDTHPDPWDWSDPEPWAVAGEPIIVPPLSVCFPTPKQGVTAGRPGNSCRKPCKTGPGPDGPDR